MEIPKKQVCSIRIMFAVDTDEQAIEVKKKIEAAVAEIPDAQTQFSIMSVPTTPQKAT